MERCSAFLKLLFMANNGSRRYIQHYAQIMSVHLVECSIYRHVQGSSPRRLRRPLRPPRARAFTCSKAWHRDSLHSDCFQGNLRPEEALQALTIYEGKFGRLKDDREKCAKAKEALELTDTGLLSGSEERVQVGAAPVEREEHGPLPGLCP